MDRRPTRLTRSKTPETKNSRVTEDLRESLVTDLGERRVHHEEEPHRDRNRGRADRGPCQALGDRRGEVPEGDAREHGEENPERQIPIEEREAARRVGLARPDWRRRRGRLLTALQRRR